jgi:hypothetical protein
MATYVFNLIKNITNFYLRYFIETGKHSFCVIKFLLLSHAKKKKIMEKEFSLIDQKGICIIIHQIKK